MDLRYRHADRETPKGTVLISHGLAEHSGRFVPLQDALVAAGYDVAFYDHRGHGTSSGPRATVDVGVLIKDHLDARRVVLAHARTPDLFCFGHSMGGLVTAASSLLDPSHLRGTVLTGPALRPAAASVPTAALPALRAAARLLPALPTVPGHKDGTPSSLSRDPRVQEAFDADPLTYNGPTPLLTAATIVSQGAQVIRHADRVRTPILIFHGSADALAALSGTRAFVSAAVAAHPDADIHLRVIDGAYHEVLNEPEGPGLIRDIVSWLDQH